jgi:hypothetical protein
MGFDANPNTELAMMRRQRARRRGRRLRHSSHSIINEPYKLLTIRVLSAAAQSFTVTFAVNLSGTSNGAGLRAVLRKLTFRDLSRSIDSWALVERFIAPRRSPRSAPKKKVHQTR